MLKHLATAAALFFCLNGPALSEQFSSPSILVLGDSQIPFGSGPEFVNFFENIQSRCPAPPEQLAQLDRFADKKVAVIGVRSTSIQSWTSESGATKGALCNVDPKWKVNAGTYGYINTTGNQYKQIGQGAAYQFCERGRTAFDVMFRPDYYDPKLIFLFFLGNATDRWANHYDLALDDVRKLNAQLPEDVPCIFMTTAPSYSKKVTDRRLKAQANIKRAFSETKSQCSFIEGSSPDTVAANQGNRSFFRRNSSGAVKDPYHPNQRAAKAFFDIQAEHICNAVYDQLGSPPAAPQRRQAVQADR